MADNSFKKEFVEVIYRVLLAIDSVNQRITTLDSEGLTEVGNTTELDTAYIALRNLGINIYEEQ